jgi:signal peptidase I
VSRARRPLVAAFASLLLPGLGQIYCGEAARGVALVLSLALPLPSAAWLALHGPRPALLWLVAGGVLIALAIYAYAVVDAYRSAARRRDEFVPGAWNRPVVYLAVMLFGQVFVLAPSARVTRANLIETFKVPSASMLPTIIPGDRFFADKRVGHRGGRKLRRGDIAVFVYPNDRTTMFVKRVVGLPGDKIQIDGTRVMVNGVGLVQEELHELGDPALGHLLEEHVAFRESIDGRSYRVAWRRDADHPSLALTVPNGQVFVLGDNRDQSQDSRHFGVLPMADVTGVARQVWFSSDPRDGIRLRRTGVLLE